MSRGQPSVSDHAHLLTANLTKTAAAAAALHKLAASECTMVCRRLMKRLCSYLPSTSLINSPSYIHCRCVSERSVTQRQGDRESLCYNFAQHADQRTRTVQQGCSAELAAELCMQSRSKTGETRETTHTHTHTVPVSEAISFHFSTPILCT